MKNDDELILNLIDFLEENGYMDLSYDVCFVISEDNLKQIINIFGENNEYVNHCIEEYNKGRITKVARMMFSVYSAFLEIYSKEEASNNITYIRKILIDMENDKQGEE